MKKPPPFPKVERPSVPLVRVRRAYHHHNGCDCPACWPEGEVEKPAKQQLLKDAVAALARASAEESRSRGAVWALYDCLFSILEHLGAEGLPQKESEGEEHG
jgi:hypothetical protein